MKYDDVNIKTVSAQDKVLRSALAVLDEESKLVEMGKSRVAVLFTSLEGPELQATPTSNRPVDWIPLGSIDMSSARSFHFV